MEANLTVVQVMMKKGKATIDQILIKEHFTGSPEGAEEKVAEYAKLNSSQNNSDIFYVCYLTMEEKK